jgi:hypothetical protein
LTSGRANVDPVLPGALAGVAFPQGGEGHRSRTASPGGSQHGWQVSQPVQPPFLAEQ